MDRYPPIAEHGLIGNLQTAALVTTDGTIDWFCCPRFDAPSLFGSLLDRDRGGHFRIAPQDDCTVKQLYFPDTAILVTRFMTPDGVGEVIDFMPVDDPHRASDRHRLVRVVRCVRGQMRFVLDCAPRFDYGRQAHDLETTEHGAVFRTPALQLTLHGLDGLERRGDDVRATMTLQAGQVQGVVLESAATGPPRQVGREELLGLFGATARFWRDWLARSSYRGRWREQVARSAITLKLLTYAPTGALVAAPTTGLPELVGGERNWDYRYTWVRDAAFSIHALLGLGFTGEAEAFLRWLSDRAAEQAGQAEGLGPLKIMYRIDGSADLQEQTLDHWEGYAGSKPVRIGNGAADQLQLDIYGELLDSIWLADRHGLQIGHPGWVKLAQLTDWLCGHWDQPDEGVWETRGGRQNFTYGRLMSWVALDRMIRLASEHGRPADLARWIDQRNQIYRQIMEGGWNQKRRAFTQHDKTEVLDASLLMLPLVGFVVPSDPMWLATLEAMDAELVSDSLVYRYDPSASPDGLRGHEGTFSICTFWYVDALARSGRLEQARYAFEKMFTYANHLGLYAEEIGQTGEQLGNFPQAFTHLSLINAAITLDRQLDQGHGQDPVRLGRTV
jgi:GH15 family glucan-1,4-alpha-glucosidase